MHETEAGVFLNEYDLNESDLFLQGYVENPYLSKAVSKPLSERLEGRAGAVEVGLNRLREMLDRVTFGRYIDSLERVTVSGSRALLIAPTELHRTLIERELIASIREAFGVDTVRVVARR